MTTLINPLAGRPAQASMLIDVDKPVSAYHTDMPDPTIASQRVAFGTSGHRGSAFDRSFNEWHVLSVGAGANVLVFGRFQNADGFASALA